MASVVIEGSLSKQISFLAEKKAFSFSFLSIVHLWILPCQDRVICKGMKGF